MADSLFRTDSSLLAGVTELFPSGVVLVGADGQPVWADDEAAALFDLPSAGCDLSEMPDMFALDNTRIAPAKRTYMEVFDSGEPQEELYYRADLGDERATIRLDATPITDGADVAYVALAVEEVDDPGLSAADRSEPSPELQTVFDRISEAYATLDEELCITFVNEEATELLQLSERELIGSDVWELFPEARETAVYDRFTETLETREPTSLKIYYDPLELWVEARVFPVDGGGVSVYFRDIGGRKSREQELKQYETVVENIHDGVYVMDEEGRFVMVNDAYTEMTGYSRAELLGEPGAKLVDETTAARARELHRNPDASDEMRLEAELQTKDGETVDAEATFGIVEGEDGTSRRIGVVRNVSEQKARKRELEARERQQEAVARLGRIALDDPELDALFEEAASVVADVLDNDYCKVLDLDRDADELLLRQGVGWQPGYVGEATVAASEDKSQAAYTLSQAEPVVVEHLATDARIDGPELLTDHDVTSGISTIIGTTDDPWGILGTHDTDRTSFSEHDVDFVQSVANLLSATIETHRRRERLEEVADVFRTAHEISIRDAPLEERARDLLALGRDFLGFDAGFQTHIEDETQTLELVSSDIDPIEEGAQCPLEQAYCKTVLDEEGLVAVADAKSAGWVGDPAYEEWEFGAYVGHVMSVDGQPYGSVGFVADDPRDGAFEPMELAFLEQTTQWLSQELSRRRHEREVEQSHTRYQTLVENFPNGAVTLFDDDCRYTIVGGETPPGLEISMDELAGHRPDELLPDAVGETLLRNYRATLDGERRSFMVEHRGQVRKVQTIPIRGEDGTVRSGMSLSQDITERRLREQKLRHEHEQVRVVNEINSLIHDVSESVVRQSDPTAIHSTVERRLQHSEFYDAAWVGEISTDRGAIAAATDAETEGLPVRPPVDVDTAGALPSVRAAQTEEMQVTRTFSADDEWGQACLDRGVEAVAAIPFTYEDTLYGILTLYTERSDAFTDTEREALDRLGTVVAHAIRSSTRESQLRRSERLYRTLAENIPNGYVTMVDGDCRYQAVAGTLIDALGGAAPSIQGNHPSEVGFLSDDAADAIESSFETALSGEANSRQLELNSRIIRREVLPIRDETTGDVVSAMALSQDVTERIEHREELERERERLEFLVRLVRHNLLNSLNLVTARLELVEGRVDYEVSHHLETAMNRAAAMTELVETIRDLTSAVIGSEEHTLEPVALEAVVAEQVESAAISYPDAEFELESTTAAEIVADDLLKEALENLFDNAVQHNDKQTPSVTVDMTATDDTVTVRIADNGPGIPDNLRESIFGEGTRGFEDPGTGFGLHIVREVVHSYDGTIAVSDNDPEGTVFELSFPRKDT